MQESLTRWLRDLGHIPIDRMASDPAAWAGLVALRYSQKAGEGEKLRVLPEVLLNFTKNDRGHVGLCDRG